MSQLALARTFLFFDHGMPTIDAPVSIGRSPGPHDTFHNVIYFPDCLALYDRDGLRLEATCIRRGAEQKVIGSPPGQVVVPSDLPITMEPVVYLGPLYWSHWGHFLTVGIARLWSLHAVPALQEVPHLAHRRFMDDAPITYIDNFLSMLGCVQPLLIPRVPTLFSEVIVPKPSFVIRAWAFQEHTIATYAVARRVQTEPIGAPIYVSRSRLKRQQDVVEGEVELESHLVRAGIEIVHPQELSLERQVQLFSSRNIFIGVLGSALHSILFNWRNDSNTIILCPQSVNTNYFLVDELVKTRATYIRCVDLPKRAAGVLQLNVDAALQGLRDVGFL